MFSTVRSDSLHAAVLFSDVKIKQPLLRSAAVHWLALTSVLHENRTRSFVVLGYSPCRNIAEMKLKNTVNSANSRVASVRWGVGLIENISYLV